MRWLFWGFVLPLGLLVYFGRRLRDHPGRHGRIHDHDWHRQAGLGGMDWGRSWHQEWDRQWASKHRRREERRERNTARYAERGDRGREREAQRLRDRAERELKRAEAHAERARRRAEEEAEKVRRRAEKHAERERRRAEKFSEKARREAEKHAEAMRHGAQSEAEEARRAASHEEPHEDPVADESGSDADADRSQSYTPPRSSREARTGKTNGHAYKAAPREAAPGTGGDHEDAYVDDYEDRYDDSGRRRRRSKRRKRRDETPEEAILRRARKRAQAEVGFYRHLVIYLAVITGLAFIDGMTSGFVWFYFPAMGWGIGVFSHFMSVFGSRFLRDRFFNPAVEREVRRETMNVRTEKQAHIDEISATIAHEIRNPIAAAKSLVQQMGEDPRSVENVEYAGVALEELDRVERSVSHLLRYAKEEDFEFQPTNLAGVVDGALTEMRAKLDAAGVAVQRNYIGGPTIVADGEKLRQVFANVLDNAIDAFADDESGRKIELFIENGIPNRAKVRISDNGAGIPDEKIERIFNPFFTTKEHGTGLGMAVSKKIVEAHDGTIDVTSQSGDGTEFVVTLPLPH